MNSAMSLSAPIPLHSKRDGLANGTELPICWFVLSLAGLGRAGQGCRAGPLSAPFTSSPGLTRPQQMQNRPMCSLPGGFLDPLDTESQEFEAGCSLKGNKRTKKASQPRSGMDRTKWIRRNKTGGNECGWKPNSTPQRTKTSTESTPRSQR